MTNDVLDTMPFNSYGPSLAAILMYEELYVQVGRAGPECRRRWSLASMYFFAVVM